MTLLYLLNLLENYKPVLMLCTCTAKHGICKLMQLKLMLSYFQKIEEGKRRKENIQFLYNNEPLTIVDDFQYLGIIFSRKGSFKACKSRLLQQARKAMFYVLCKSRKLCLPIDILLQLFDVMISPILMYGSEIWGYENIDIIERVHLRYLKHILI